jgi:hypothetical protein
MAREGFRRAEPDACVMPSAVMLALLFWLFMFVPGRAEKVF